MAVANSVNYLGVEYGEHFLKKAMEQSKEGQALEKSLNEMGLYAQSERSHVFNVFSPDDLRSIAICITPFSGEDRSREGGLSISEGGHSQAVVVEMRDNKLVGFTHLALEGGSLRSEHFDAQQLLKVGAKRLSAEAGKVKSAKHLIELNARQTTSLSSVAFNSLLSDDFARSTYSSKEIAELRTNNRIVSEISRFVLLRTSGSACCSCSTSCWGSCSSSCSYVG